MTPTFTAEWITEAGGRIATHFERELEAMVAISSPSGDVAAAEELCSLVAALVPDEAEIERPPCSTAGHAPDLLATIRGTGAGKLLLLGHLDTVVAHPDHRPLAREDGRLIGSGTVDMKGGVAIALGVMRELARFPEAFAELCLLTVVDEEWRTGGFAHGPRFAGFDACLCFEAGQLGPAATEAVVAKRKAAATLEVIGHGVAAHSGSSPEKGRNVLLALGEAARRIAALSDPAGPERLTAIPTVLHSGDAFNVVPAAGELICDLRAERLAAFEPVLAAVPDEIDGVRPRGGARPPVARHGQPRAGRRAADRARRGAARRPAGDRRARWRQRREPPRRARAAHPRRARATRRPRASPGRVRRRRLGPPAGRGRARGRRRGARIGVNHPPGA